MYRESGFRTWEVNIMKRKLSKLGRSTVSVLLCLGMLLTTFCFFDIGSVISEALVSKSDHALTEAGSDSSTFAKYNILMPELVYQGRRKGLGIFSERNVERHGQRADFRNRRVQLLLCNGEKCNYFNNRS